MMSSFDSLVSGGLSASVEISGGQADILHELDWDMLEQVSSSEEGSTGVFFCTFSGDKKIVVKGCNSVVQELMCGVLALVMNIRVPRIRLVTACQHQWSKMSAAMKRRCTKAELRLKLDKHLDRAFYLLQEFIVEGKDLMRPPEQIEPLFTLEHFAASSKTNLRDVGLLGCLDLVCNNPDRLPLVWDNWGNLANVMVSRDQQIVGIDNGCGCIPPSSPLYARYLKKVETLVANLLAMHPGAETPETARVRLSLRTWGMDPDALAADGIPPFGYDITVAGSIEIQNGLLEGMARFSELSAEQIAQVVALVHRANQKYDWMDIWQAGVNATPADFFNAVIDIFRANRPAILLALESCPGAQPTSHSTAWKHLLENLF